MKKSNQLLIGLTIIVVLAIAAFNILYFKNKGAANQSITGTVTNVVDRPNQAEDGYYGIEAKDSEGNSYSINATGYLNSPEGPSYFGEYCVDIPKVSIGQSIGFRLPKDENGQYINCYKRNDNYFFRVN